MQLFRRLADTIFFKIILAFVILSFVLFGISGFLLGQSDSWVAKIGDEQVSYDEFLASMKNDRKIILASGNNPEISQYLESARFKTDVLGRLVNKKIANKLTEEYGFTASKDLILKSIVNDSEFTDNDGKFSRDLFNKFLTKHSLNEEKYIELISNEIVTSLVVQTIGIVSPVNEQTILELANFSKEERLANIITISESQIRNSIKPSDEKIAKFYEQNTGKYITPEYRKISFLTFNKNDFDKSVKVSEAEIKDFYENNKDQFSEVESRNFYHVIFDDKASADKFLKDLGNKTNQDQFAKLAKKSLNKNLDEIKLTNITKDGFLPELANKVFSYKVGDVSEVLNSTLGFHIFLTTKIKAKEFSSLAQVKDLIKTNLIKNHKKNIVEEKISEINDIILATNSLEEVVKKLKLKTDIVDIEFNREGLDKKGNQVKAAKDLLEFTENAFALNIGQTSQIFYTKDYQGFYLFQVKDIIQSHTQKLSDIKNLVKKDLIKNSELTQLQNLAQKIAQEVKINPDKADKIAKQYGVSYQRDRTFLNSNKALNKEIFNLRKGDTTKEIMNDSSNYEIAILTKINYGSANSEEYSSAKSKAIKDLRNNIMQKYNEAMTKKNPITINEKFFN